MHTPPNREIDVDQLHALSVGSSHQELTIAVFVGGKHFDVRFYADGQGPVILLLHGWAHSGKRWTILYPYLNSQFRLISLDLPGFGKTPAIQQQKDVTLKIYGALLREILQGFSSTEKLSAVVADSLSAVLLLFEPEPLYLLRCPLVISGCPVDGLPWMARLAGNSPKVFSFGLTLLQRLPRIISRPIVRILSLTTVSRLSLVDDVLIDDVLRCHSGTAGLLLSQLAKLQLLHRISSPIPRMVVLRGAQDKVTSREANMNLARHTQSTYVEIPLAGHTPMLENPAAYAREIIRAVNP